MWPFTKSTVIPENPSKREFEIVQRISTSMEECPDKWLVSGTTAAHYGNFKFYEKQGDSCNVIEVKVRPSNYEDVQLFYNSAKMSLVQSSKDTLREKATDLLQEKVIRSMTRVEEDLSNEG